ncbi:MAG: hypothetical protein Kow0047_07260 [Anaerolineae bacterium]
MASVQRVCPHCGEAYAVDDRTCPYCGRTPDEPIAIPGSRSLAIWTAKALAPVAVGLVGVVARLGIRLTRELLRRAFSPSDLTSSGRSGERAPDIIVEVWEEHEITDAHGDTRREQRRGRWHVYRTD